MIAVDGIIWLVEALLKLSMIVMVGLYFIFSNTVMKTLGNVTDGANVMVEINKVILNPVFMTCFIVSGIAGVYFVFSGNLLLTLSGATFVLGTTLVTMVKNVPLNNQLLFHTEPEARQQVWLEYLDKWVFWNHIRTCSAIASSFLLVL